MIHMFIRKECMQQSFDRGTRVLGINHAMSKIFNHLFIRHGFTFELMDEHLPAQVR